MNNPKGIISHKFVEAEQRCKDFPAELEKVSRELGVHFLDANTLIKVSEIDGIHLDGDQYSILVQKVADYLQKIKVLSWP
ncbi:hypothetical protein [Microbulbifer epialgicus]|uniref:Uncharacterized protein n=1 Tax=Microbulbifer epialgicus TaxID=393907 RepID=A0ABV4P6W8_9GAMM